MRDRTFYLLIVLGFAGGAAVLYFIEQPEGPRSPVDICTSALDGSVRGSKQMIKDQLREPDSFEHIGTQVTSIDDDGRMKFLTRFRAKNGFGGFNVESATVHAKAYEDECWVISADIRGR